MAKTNDNPKALTPPVGIISFAAVLWLLHLLPLLMPQSRLWGFNHLLFLPSLFLYIYIIGGIASLAMFYPPLRDIGGRLYKSIATIFFDQRNKTRWLIASAVALVIFWIGRLPIFLLGDSYSVIENIGNDLPIIYKWSEIGAIVTASAIAKLLPFSGSELGKYAYNIISVVSGAGTIFLFFALAFELGKDAAGRLFIFCLSIFAGWIVLFFGYTENYPILWPFMVGYIYFAARYINKQGNLLWPTLMLLIALMLHLQVLFFLISYPILLVARGTGARIFRKNKMIVWAVVGVIVIAAGALFVHIYKTSLEFRLFIIPLLDGHPATPYYSFFSIAHLVDIANQFLLMVPLLPALIVLGWRGWRSITANKLDLFLFLLSFGGVAFLFIIDPKLGMPRDWDLFALAGLPPMILFAKNIVDSKKIRSSMLPAIVLITFIMVMPFWATNLIKQPSIDNYKYLLNLDLNKSRTGITLLRGIAKAENDSLLADSLKNVIAAAYPAATLAPLALELADQGRLTEAMILVDSMARFDPYSVEVYNLRGLVSLRQGRYAQAIQSLEKAAQFGRYDARPLASLASAYNRLGQMDKMMDALRRGQERDPDLHEIQNGLMTAFYSTRQYDSALVYAKIVMQDKPTFANSYWVMGNIALQSGNKAQAKIYLTRFIELSEDEAMKNAAAQALQQLQ